MGRRIELWPIDRLIPRSTGSSAEGTRGYAGAAPIIHQVAIKAAIDAPGAGFHEDNAEDF